MEDCKRAHKSGVFVAVQSRKQAQRPALTMKLTQVKVLQEELSLEEDDGRDKGARDQALQVEFAPSTSVCHTTIHLDYERVLAAWPMRMRALSALRSIFEFMYMCTWTCGSIEHAAHLQVPRSRARGQGLRSCPRLRPRALGT